jgi:hypothetical protein
MTCKRRGRGRVVLLAKRKREKMQTKKENKEKPRTGQGPKKSQEIRIFE